MIDEQLSAPAAGARPAAGRDSHTVRAAGVAGAQLAANGIALAATVAFARALGTARYGELARMVSVFTVLLVPISALQIAAAREMALGRLGSEAQARLTLGRWLRRIVLAAVAAMILCALLRQPLADLMRVSQPWAAATVLPAGVLWAALAVQRGVLQGAGAYALVGSSLVAEQGFRLVLGAAAVLAGGGVTSIFVLSVPAAIVPMAAGLWLIARRRLGSAATGGSVRLRLRELVRGNPVALAALTLLAVVQNADVVAIGHVFPSRISGAYAEAAVAAKGIVWVAVGLGLYLLPEATREAAGGRDARHLLARTTGLLALVALPALLVFAVASGPVLDLVFGDRAKLATGALPWLAAAMALLSVSYLAVQHELGVGRRGFLVLAAAGAIAAPLVVTLVGGTLERVAVALLILNAVLSAGLVAAAVRPGIGECAPATEPLASAG